MKYIYIYFIAYVVASTAAEEVLLSSQQSVCACKDLLSSILHQVSNEYSNLEELSNELNELEKELRELQRSVVEQGDQLSTIARSLATISVLRDAIREALQNQDDIFQCIRDNLQELAKEVRNTEINNNNQSDAIDGLIKVSWETYECNNRYFCKAS